MELIEKLTLRMPDADSNILQQALDDAEGMIMDVCNRTSIPSGMQNLQLALAETYARRMMAEGEESRAEGDVSVHNAYTMEIPEDLMKRILAHRRLKQAKVANEA